MKQFPIDVVLSLTTRFLLKDHGFGEMHELAEYVAGRPVWTHEFASEQLNTQLAEAVFAQHPTLRDVEPFEGEGEWPAIKPYLDAYVKRQVLRYGATLSIEPGAAQEPTDPISTLSNILGKDSATKSIIAIQAPINRHSSDG